MQYFPKSSINILEASKGELIYKGSKKSYIGMYIETNKGKFYAGSNYLNLGPELVKPESSELNFGISKAARKYTFLKNPQYNKLKKYKTIIPSKGLPNEIDYENGYFVRFFVQRVNDEKELYEISQQTYDDFDKQIYDEKLFQRGSLIWVLEGSIRKINKLTLENLVSRFPYIQSLFSLLNEFESINNSDKLFTQGGELYYENGREYTGLYHIHKGIPMVGEMHTEESHATLIFAKDLQTPNELNGFKDFNYEDFLKEKKAKERRKFKKKRTQTVSNISRNIFRSSSPSRGGGY